MNRYIIAEKHSVENHAGSKARNDIVNILMNKGWEPVWVIKENGGGIANKIAMCFITVKDWFLVCCKIKSKACMIVQYPLANYPKVSFLAVPFLKILKKLKKIKLIYLVHDLDSMRMSEQRNTEKNGETIFLEMADGIVSHNSRMTTFIRKMGIQCPVTEIGIFDYLTDVPLNEKKMFESKNSIAIAGNLKKEKAGYLYKMEDQPSSLKWMVYGPNFEGNKSKTLVYCGQFPAEELPGVLNAGFGLVWDGNSCTTCSGRFGEYLRYNNPHKLSLYLASGLPVIVWKESALAEFVEKKQVGFAISSLYEIEDRISKITELEYQTWKKNVFDVARGLRNGHNTIEAIVSVMQKMQ